MVLFWIILHLVINVCAEIQNNITIQTKLGLITGTRSILKNTPIYKFLKIPFAKAPTGNLRFAKPLPFGKWQGTLDATKLGPACMQPSHSTTYLSEDCLHLNIFVPNVLKPIKRKSVMVWIHGGSYQSESGTQYDGSKISVTGDVIVVTINYRLGIFGYFSLSKSTVKGNFGIWDQILALQWMQANIEDFGGDPSSITIFGESAGAFSVGLLTLIPSNRGLFHRAILQSGTPNSMIAFGMPQMTSLIVGINVGCHYSRSNDSFNHFLNCMRRANASVLTQKSEEFRGNMGLQAATDIHFTPVIDNELLHEDPVYLLLNKSSSPYTFFRSLDVIIGNCDMEGSLLFNGLKATQNLYHFNISKGIPNSFFCYTLLPQYRRRYFGNNAQVSNAICKMYSKIEDYSAQSELILNMFSDMLFISPAIFALNVHADNNESKTYQYIFSQDSICRTGSRPLWYKGSVHWTDVSYLFFDGHRGFHGPIPDDSLHFSEQMRTYWTNFAKNGNPNSAHLPRWMPYDVRSSNYMQLNSSNLTMSRNYRKYWTDFWLAKIPVILNRTSCNHVNCKLYPE